MMLRAYECRVEGQDGAEIAFANQMEGMIARKAEHSIESSNNRGN